MTESFEARKLRINAMLGELEQTAAKFARWLNHGVHPDEPIAAEPDREQGAQNANETAG